MARRSNKKTEALRGILKNENLTKTLQKAITSPLGSTDRKRAQRILSIVRKTDGAGGPGINIPRQNVQLMPRTYDYSRLVIFPAAPPIKIKPGQKKPKNDGQGGPGDVKFGLDFNMFEPSSPLGNSMDFSMKTSTPATTFKPAPIQTYDQYKNDNAVNDGVLSSLSSQIFRDNPIPGVTNPSVPNAASPGATRQPNPTPPPPSTGGGGSSFQQPSTTGGGSSFAMGPTVDTTFNNPYDSGNISSKYPGIQSAVDQGIGPSMFAYQAMGRGADYLSSLPGFENMPESSLAGGASLSGRISEIEKALRSSYRLDELLNQGMDLVNKGVGLEGRLNDYIRGRDEFLNQTDGMIENLKKKSMTMDLSDPRNRNAVNDHLGYLYELRGRQNKRYVEFVSTSIDQYNQKLSSIEGMYSTALDGYQRELQTKAAVTTEEYKLMFGALTEMYSEVADAPMKALEMERLNAEIAAIEASIISDITDQSTFNSESYVDARKNLEDVGAIDKNGGWVVNDYSSLSVQNPAAFLTNMLDAGRQAMNYQDDEGRYRSPENIEQIASNIMGHIRNLEGQGLLDSIGAQSAISSVQQSMAQAFRSSGVIGSDDAKTVRDAVEAIAGDNNWWWGFSGSAPSRQEFISQFEESNLPEIFLDTIYSDYEYGFTNENRKDFSAYTTDREGNQLSDDELVNVVINSYLSKLRPQQISGGGPNYSNQQVSQGSGNRPQRNNNPLNIKSSNATNQYAGVVGIDPSPATDGGQFLVFNSPQDGFDAAKRLIQTSGYTNLTVDQAMRRWSNNGYGGEIAPEIANKKINQLTDAELNQLVQTMAAREGYYA